MFEDSILELRTKKRSPWATLFSFAFQAGLVFVMILIPLIYTEALPKQQLMTFLVAPPPPPPPPPPPAAQPVVRVAKVVSELDNGELRTPTKIPRKILIAKDEDQPVSASAGVVGGVPGGVPGGQMGGVIGGIISSTPVAVPKVATPQRVRVSAGVTEGLLIHKVQPVYPPLARSARIQGQVVLQAVIGKDGTIQNLRAVSGHPMLTPSAIDAVKQWRYKPYFLNGEPVEVDTQITVNFTLAGG
jgi:protein TonB